MNTEEHDVAIVGAGPAGATAALLLARQKHRVVLLEAAKFPHDEGQSVWLGSKAASLLDEIGVTLKSLSAQPFKNVTFHNSDFTKTAKPKFTAPAGYMIRRGVLENVVVRAGTRAGATLIEGARCIDARLAESSVELKIEDERCITARLMLLAVGRSSPLLARCGFRYGTGEVPFWTAQLDSPLPDPVTGGPQIAVVLGLDRGGSFALICAAGGQLSVSINWGGQRVAATPALVNVCKLGYERGVIPLDLSQEAAAVELVASPASAALDMETHVGKHTLLIGDAGGFVSAASNEGIYPAMWSAHIASQVASAALAGTFSQDELMTFDSKWRMKMADYLRSPNTDPQFLLPLIFSNQAMADRMGAAFFHGENI